MSPVVLAVIEQEGRWFLQRRDPASPVMPGLWEFPGGKVEPEESLRSALLRELQEEIAVSVVALEAWGVGDGDPVLHLFRVRILGRPVTPLAWGWFTPAELLRLPLPPRNLALIQRLASGEGR